ncbi:hypothetical protein I5735_15470 [Acinetobacter baumannii]|nr:hypothetical protein [Acinetobacter baumannii]
MMIMCIGGINDGTLISYIDSNISIPVQNAMPEKMNFDPNPFISPVIYPAESYRLEKFRFNNEYKFVYIFSKLTNEEVLDEVQKRWHQMDLS